MTDEALALLVGPWATRDGQPAFYRQIAQAEERFTEEFEHLFDRLTEPVHIVWGAEDAWIPVDRAARLQSMLPGSTSASSGERGTWSSSTHRRLSRRSSRPGWVAGVAVVVGNARRHVAPSPG